MGMINLTLALLWSLLATATATQFVLNVPMSTLSTTIPSFPSQDLPYSLSSNVELYSSEIFNSINSALRQWGSSLKHNGMGFIPVMIPSGTFLYHGTDTKNRVKGMEWLAFEIEHAEFFARGRGGPPSGKQPPPKDTQPDTQPPKGERPPPSGSTEGYFHIYQTTRDLTNLLYIDGLSAGKSRIGTLDSTDYLLRSLKPGQDSPMSERERASDLCSLSPSIEGIIRMEAGFELILCDFENGLELDQVIKRPKMRPKESHGPGGPGGMTGNLQQFEYARGVSNRYDGIGDGRIRADFSHMITAFWFGLNFTANNKSPEGDLSLPRLVNSDPEELRKVKDVVISSFETPRNQSEPSIDWQGITDMIIARYANRLKYLESNKISLEKTREELDFLLNVYIDYSNPNQTIDQSIALEKCSNHYLKSVTPKTRTDFLLKSSILNVTSTICSSLFSMRENLSTSSASSSSLKHQLQLKVSSLNAWLSWAEWLKCGRCSYDEICYVAIWPWGSKEDHFKPSCSRAEDRRNGYWEGREW